MAKHEAVKRAFLLSASIVLLVTGGAKLWSAFGDTKLLGVADPVVGMPFRHLLWAVGVVEMIVAVCCVYCKDSRPGLLLVSWLATNLVAYRLGLWWMDWHRPCNCLGNLTDALHISPQVADNIMKAVLAYLLIGSYGLLIWRWRQNRAFQGQGVADVATI